MNIRIKSGLTLIEIVVTVAIIAIGLVGMSYLFSTAFRAPMMDKIKLTSSFLAEDLMEEIASKFWVDAGCQTIGPDIGESRYNLTTVDTYYDDVDDYNGSSETPPRTVDNFSMNGTVTPPYETSPLPDYRNYRRRVVVEFVNDSFEPSVPATSYKKVTVAVDYSPSQTFNSPVYTYNISQVFAQH